MANNNIHIKVGADYTELTGLIKTTDQTKKSLDLVSKSFARTGDQKAWMSGINQIVAAQKKLESSSRMSRSEIMKLAYQYKQSAQFSDALSKATGKLAGATGQMGRRMSRTGVMYQQAGYQIGDFIVQAQSGQNVMVAFGQQATQMAGTLTMMGGKFVGIGTVLGIAIPLATAFGAALMKMKKSSDSTAESAKDLEDKLKSLKSTLKDYANTMEALRQGVSIEQLFATKGIDAAIDRLNKARTQLAISTTPAALLGSGAAGGIDIVSAYKALTGQDTKTTAALKEVIAARTQLQLLLDKEASTRFANSSISRKGLLDELELLRAIEQHGEGSTQAEQAAIAQEIRLRKEAIDAKVKSKEITVAQGVAEKKIVDSVAALNAQIRINNKLDEDKQSQSSFQEQLTAQANSLVLLEMEKEGLKDSAQYRAELVAQEADRLQKLLSQKEITEGQALDYLYLYKEILRVNSEMDASAKSAKAIDKAFKETQASLKTLVGQSSNLDVEIAKAKAQIDALKNNTDVATAAYIAGEKAKITATYETTKALALQKGHIDLLAEATLAYAEAMGKLDDLESLRTTLSGMKGDAKASKSNPLLDLQKRIALDTKLLGVSREQAQVERAIANSKREYSPKEIANTVKELEVYNLKISKMKETQALYATMESSLESGFMAMVDGTKSVEDAFKDMAKQVIAELYRILVVKRMVGDFESGTGIMGMIGGFFGGGSAPTSSIRPQMRPSSFDGGGYTGSGPRSGGMDGRGGYMAMLHPRETVIDHTKAGSAGGGESVTVVNNFNFQANGDDSVKRIIAQAAPSIANMAKQSVMDSRRRGGAMKNTFG